jgi:hypothetical protein
VVIEENVLRFARWELFEAWLKVFESMGSTATLIPVNAAHVSSPGNPAAPQMRERLNFVYLDTFEPFGPVLGLEMFLRAVYFGRVVSLLGADGLSAIVEARSRQPFASILEQSSSTVAPRRRAAV